MEWGIFWISNTPLGWNIFISTVIAFVVATFVNWILGRLTLFKKVAKKKKIGIDAAAVYLVSGIGLGLNLVLMALFVNVLGIFPLLSKILSTGIVFSWNFLSRKYFIYRENKESRADRET